MYRVRQDTTHSLHVNREWILSYILVFKSSVVLPMEYSISKGREQVSFVILRGICMKSYYFEKLQM